MMTTEHELDAVVKAVVDNLMASPHLALALGLTDEAIAEAIAIGYVERRGNDLYPTAAGATYRAIITD